MDVLDIVFIHSDGNDLHVLTQTDALQTLRDLKASGEIQAIGFSGKTIDGARRAIADGVDAIMVEYHMNDQSHAAVIDEAAAAGVGVVIKKGLASGDLKPADGLPFLLGNRNISSIVIGGLNLNHIAENLKIAASTS
jgi:aryl-alcohol dehydrogenase-like predicted oxidoreductase